MVAGEVRFIIHLFTVIITGDLLTTDIHLGTDHITDGDIITIIITTTGVTHTMVDTTGTIAIMGTVDIMDTIQDIITMHTTETTHTETEVTPVETMHHLHL